MQIIIIGLGGFIGTVLRFLLGGLVQPENSAFPWGTLAVNLIGCLGIGVLAELSEARGLLTPQTRGFLMVGILGGFTTFSAFAHETVNSVRQGVPAVAILNVGASVGLGLAAVWAGRAIANALWG